MALLPCKLYSLSIDRCVLKIEDAIIACYSHQLCIINDMQRKKFSYTIGKDVKPMDYCH